MNKVILSGNLTKDIEVIENDKIKLGKFTIAVTKPFKNSKGEYESDFFNCIVFNANDYLKTNLIKGTKALIDGYLQTRTYEIEGNKKYVTEIIVNKVEVYKPKTNPYEDFGNSIKTESKIDEQLTITDANMPF